MASRARAPARRERPAAAGLRAPPAEAAATSPASGLAPIHNGRRGQNFNAAGSSIAATSPGAQATTFNDSAWTTLDLPHDWSIALAFNSNSPAGSNAGYLDGGIGWYRKSFTVDQASSGQRILIQFDGVYMNSEVWINGTSLGTRPYGYTSFEYDLTPYVTFGGNNVIAVRVNNNQPNSRWYSGSGIYRNVWLTKLNPVQRPLQRRVRLDAVGLGRVGHGVGEHGGAEPVDGAPPPSR